MALSPLVLQASSLSGAIADLEETRKNFSEEKRQLEISKTSILSEIQNIKNRLAALDHSVQEGEHERQTIKDKIRQGREAKAKIEEGMNALLETLEREERILKHHADTN